MAEISNPNIPTHTTDLADVTSRNAEYTGTPCTDVDGDGSYNSYLGCNRAGSCAGGIGVHTGVINSTSPESFTLLDQDAAARVPQVSALIGNTGFVDRSSTDWPSSGGAEGKGDEPIRHIQQPASVPGTLDTNDTANYLAATQQAAPDAVVDLTSGAVNKTDQTVEIGDEGWFPVPVA